MASPRFAPLILAALSFAAASGAGAQLIRREPTTTTPTLKVHTPTPIASVSFGPFQLGGTIEGKPIGAHLINVSVSAPGDYVMLQRDARSAVRLTAPQGVVDGAYVVQFHFSWVNQPTTLTISDDASVLATCNLQAQNTVQICEAAVNVVGGKLVAMLEITQGMQMNLSQITLNRYQ